MTQSRHTTLALQPPKHGKLDIRVWCCHSWHLPIARDRAKLPPTLRRLIPRQFLISSTPRQRVGWGKRPHDRVNSRAVFRRKE